MPPDRVLARLMYKLYKYQLIYKKYLTNNIIYIVIFTFI